MNLGDLRPVDGARHRAKRLGKGTGSGRGGTSGKGHKGQWARSGGGVRPGYEGGQMPLTRRVPKRGFAPPNRVPYQVVNLHRLADWDASKDVTPETLAASGYVRPGRPVKILGLGDAPAGLRVRVHAVSAEVRKKIEAAGGSVEVSGKQGS